MHARPYKYTQAYTNNRSLPANLTHTKLELTSNPCFLPGAVFTLHLSQWIIGGAAFSFHGPIYMYKHCSATADTLAFSPHFSSKFTSPTKQNNFTKLFDETMQVFLGLWQGNFATMATRKVGKLKANAVNFLLKNSHPPLLRKKKKREVFPSVQ